MTTVRLETGGDLITRVSNILSPVAAEYRVRVSPSKGLRTEAVDPASVAMVSLTVPPESFETFEVEYDEVTFGLLSNRLENIASFARVGGHSEENPGDPVSLLYDADEESLYARVEREDMDHFSRWFETPPESMRKAPDIPDLDYPWGVSLDSGTLRDILKSIDAADYDYVQVRAEDIYDGVSGETTAGVEIYGSNEDAGKEDLFSPNVRAEWNGPEDTEPFEAASLFSVDYLRDMAKDLHAAKPDSAYLAWGEELPLEISFSNSNTGIRGEFALAPRITQSADKGYDEPTFSTGLFEEPEEVEA